MLNELVDFLGEPTSGHSVNDKFNRDKNIRKNTLWRLKSDEPKSNDLTVHIYNLLSFVSSKKQRFKELQGRCKLAIVFLASSESGQGAINISPEIMTELLKYDIALSFDTYLSNEE